MFSLIVIYAVIGKKVCKVEVMIKIIFKILINNVLKEIYSVLL